MCQEKRRIKYIAHAKEFDIKNLLIFNMVTIFPDLCLAVVWTATTLIFKGTEKQPCSVMLDIAQIITQGHFLMGFSFQPFIDMSVLVASSTDFSFAFWSYTLFTIPLCHSNNGKKTPQFVEWSTWATTGIFLCSSSVSSSSAHLYSEHISGQAQVWLQRGDLGSNTFQALYCVKSQIWQIESFKTLQFCVTVTWWQQGLSVILRSEMFWKQQNSK